MAPYALLPRDDDANSTASSATSSASNASSSDSASDSSSSGSWLTTHKEDIYIAVGVVAVVLFLLLLVLGKKHRLSFWPFKQKRCSGPNSCGKGIFQSDKVDKDYFENGSGGWRCLACQEKKEDSDLEKELEDDEQMEEVDLHLKDVGRRRRDREDDDEERGERKVTIKPGSNKEGRTGTATNTSPSREEAGGGANRAHTRRDEERSKPPPRPKRDDDGQKRVGPRKKRDEESDNDESD